MTKYAAASPSAAGGSGQCGASASTSSSRVFWFPVAQPVSLAYADGLSYWQRVLVEDGTFEGCDQHVIGAADVRPFSKSVTFSGDLDRP